MSETILMQGNRAVAEAALVAGVKFCAGYPITPSSETIEILAEKLPQHGGRFIQMEDELASIGAIIGASAVGKKALTATSGPGFSLMQENLGYAAMVELPIVIYNAQRVGPSTGGATKPQQGDIMQAKWGSHGDSPRIALAPATVAEIYEMTIRSFNLAEKYMVPVILMTDELLAHMRENVIIPDPDTLEILNRRSDAVSPEEYLPYNIDETGIPVLPPFGGEYRYNISGMIHDEYGIPNLASKVIDANIRRLDRKLKLYYDDIVDYEELKEQDAEILLVAYGSVTRPAKGAIKLAREAGIKVSLFRPITLWPFPEKEIRQAAAGVDKVIVAEMNMGQVNGLVKGSVENNSKVVSFNKVSSEPITTADLLKVIKDEATGRDMD